jgi:hypothetical protein
MAKQSKPVFDIAVHTIRLLIDREMRSSMYNGIAAALTMLPSNKGNTDKEKFMHIMDFGYDVVHDMFVKQLPQHHNQLSPVQQAIVGYVLANSKYGNYASFKAFMAFSKKPLIGAALQALAVKDTQFNLWKMLCSEFYADTGVRTHPFHHTPIGKFVGAKKQSGAKPNQRQKDPIVEETIVVNTKEINPNEVPDNIIPVNSNIE